MAILLWAFHFIAQGEPVAAHHLEGTLHGYLTLRTGDGQVIAAGDLLQVVHGDRVTSHLVFHFKDGSVDDETAVFSQRGNFQLISDHHIQKGPFFPHPMELSIDVRSGEVTVKSTDKDGKDELKTEHMKLPPDLYNGMILPVTKNVRTGAAEQTVSMIVAMPKPRLVKLAISPQGEEGFTLAGFERKALHYSIRIELGGVTGVVAPMVGKQPPDIQVWIEGGAVPGFVAEEGPISEDGPIVSIQQTGPSFPANARANEPHAGGGN
jgi:hypothetical protein